MLITIKANLYLQQSYIKGIIPTSWALHQNYPNPFNPITTLKYDLPKDTFVKITLFDMNGETVKTLVNEEKSSGSHHSQWDATNNKGEFISAGVYLYRIETGDFRQTKKMIYLK